MHKILNINILQFLLLIVPFVLTAQEMGFEEYNPTSTLVVPVNEIKSAKYPFIDVHSHQRSMAKEDLKKLVNDMDALNEGIMINLSGGSGTRLEKSIANIKQTYPSRFAVFAN